MKLLKLADRTVSVLGLILFGVLTGFSLFLTSYFALTYEEIPHTKGDIFPLVLLICGLLTFLMYRFSGWMLKKEEGQERRIRILAGAVCLYALVFGIWWVGAAKCLPLGDQNSVCTAAAQFREGNYEMLTIDSYEKYLFIHPHQLGLTALIELTFALFGNGNYVAFEYLNCVGAAVTLYAGYRITRVLTNRKQAWIYYLLLAAACFPLLFYVVFVYGEIPSITFSALAILGFLEYRKQGAGQKRLLWLAFACVTCALACLVRNNCLILLLAFVLIQVTTALGERNIRPLVAALLLVLTFGGARTALRSSYEARSGIELNQGAPMLLYVAMGMQQGEGAPGWSNGYILHNYWGVSDFDYAASEAMAKQDIRTSASEFVHHPKYALRFFVGKFASEWNDPTYECYAMTHVGGDDPRGAVADSIFNGTLHTVFEWFMNQYQSLIYGGVFLWLLYGFWRKKDLSVLVLMTVIFGGFLFHMLWEAKGRYILPYFVMMLPMAAAGLSELSDRVNSWLRKHGKVPDRTKG